MKSMKKKYLWALLLLLAVLLCWSQPESALAAEAKAPYYSQTSSWSYTLHHDVTLTNQSSRLAHDIEVRVPLMDASLPSYMNKKGEQLSPYPDEIILDEYGQRVAIYHISSLPAESCLTLRQTYALDTASQSYHVDWAALDDYSALERSALAPYLQSEALIQSKDAAILAFARNAVGRESNPYRKAQLLFSAVNLALDYSDKAALPQDAKSVLNRKNAHCEGYTNLYIACLRALGIPARVVSGYLYMPEKHVSSDYVDQASGSILLDSLRHVWVEFYVPDTGWVMADPTFTYTYEIGGSTQKFVDWSYFANISTGRRYLFFSYGDSGNDKYQVSYTGGEVVTGFRSSLTTGRDYVPFNDLSGHWAAEAATYGVEQGYFNGLNESLFGPDEHMTRAMFVTVLGRLYQARGGQLTPYQANLGQFTDIDHNGYYADALGWALDCGLIDGYGNGRFGPDDPITRQQMAKIIAVFVSMVREEEGLGLAAPQVVVNFADLGQIAVWAMNGVEFCVGLGLITGHNDGYFRPNDFASRGQVAAILQRIDNSLR